MKYFIFNIFILLTVLSLSAQDDCELQPKHIEKPPSVNLIPNGSFEVDIPACASPILDGNWCTYDCTGNTETCISSDDGIHLSEDDNSNRFLRFNKNKPGVCYDRVIQQRICLNGRDDQTNECIDWDVAETEPITFTLSFKTRTIDTWPSPIISANIWYRDAMSQLPPGGFLNDANQHIASDRFVVSKNNEWQECVSFFKIDPNEINEIAIDINYNYAVSGVCNSVEIDDVYLGRGKGFDNPPECKEPFNSPKLKIDELGNFYNNENGQHFFPIGIMGGQYRFGRDDNNPDYPDRDIYASKGFNTRCYVTAYFQAQEGVDADLPWFNLDLTNWTHKDNISDGWYKWSSLFDTEQGLPKIYDKGLLDNLLCYYVDNEKEVPKTWHSIPRAVEKVKLYEKTLDFDGDGIPDQLQSTPIFLLNGTYGIARQYKTNYSGYTGIGADVNSNINVGDFTGTYIDGDNDFPTLKFDLINNLQGQQMPAPMAQINSITDNSMGARLFAAIAHGAKGMNYWRDTSPGNPNYIPDFPDCRQYEGQVIDLACPDYDSNNGLFRYIYDKLNIVNEIDDLVDIDGNALVDNDNDGLYSKQVNNNPSTRILDIDNEYLDIPFNLNDDDDALSPFLPTNKHLVDVTEAEWWDGFRDVTDDIKAILPLIKEPHWTDWTVSHDRGCEIDFGTRNLNGEGYLIVANLEDNVKIVNFTIDNLDYVPSETYVVRHSLDTYEGYHRPPFDIANDGSSFKAWVALEPFGYGVIRLSNELFSCPSNTDNLNTQKPFIEGLEVKQFCNNNRIRFMETVVEADKYQFRYQFKTNGVWSNFWRNTLPITNNTININNIPSGTTNAKVRMRIQCNGVWSGWSDVEVFTFPSCKRGPDINVNKIVIYPNPANQQVSINLNELEFKKGSISIFDFSGKEVSKNTLFVNQNSATLKTGDLSNGVYLIKIITDGQEIHTQKLTIAH